MEVKQFLEIAATIGRQFSHVGWPDIVIEYLEALQWDLGEVAESLGNVVIPSSRVVVPASL